MSLTAAQNAAFQNGVGGPSGGYTPGQVAVLLGLIAAAILVLWAAYAISHLGEDYFTEKLELRQMVFLSIRVLVLVLLMVMLLW